MPRSTILLQHISRSECVVPSSRSSFSRPVTVPRQHPSSLRPLLAPHRVTPNNLSNTTRQTPRRHFNLSSLSSFLPGNNNNNNNGSNSSPDRILTATRTLPYSPEGLFTIISSVEAYSQFLPFLT